MTWTGIIGLALMAFVVLGVGYFLIISKSREANITLRLGGAILLGIVATAAIAAGGNTMWKSGEEVWSIITKQAPAVPGKAPNKRP